MGAAGTETEKLKDQRLYYHRVGTKQEEDTLVYEDPTQPLWMFDGTVTNDGKYLLIGVAKDTNRVNLLYYVDLTLDQNKDISGKLEPTKLIEEWIGEFDYL
jgi:prolyl oligopeptidase